MRDGELVLRVPAGEAAVFRFDQVEQAEQLRIALVLGLAQLRGRR